jgi:pSer/pThr/pTyr-binding forkhead associated (FHA) protein
MFGLLRVITGPDRGQTITLVEGESRSIGRGPVTEVQLRDLAVARKHCEVRLAGGRVTLTDFNSVTGTQVNGQSVTQCELQPGDLIRVGNTTLSFQWSSADEQTTRGDQ